MDRGTLKISAHVPIVCGLLLAGISSSCGLSAWAQSNLPNIVYILADDMGIGDIRSYNPNSPVNTPNLDRIANAGMRFTNAHSSSSVCSPTRYSLLTGRYAWRGVLKSDVVRIYGPPIVEPSRLTAAKMLQEAGYSTGAFGKWHLGAQWVTTDGAPTAINGSNVDHSQPFTGGPVDHGFDTFFGIDGSSNFPPYAYIQDDRTVGIPTGQVRGNPQNPVNWPGPITPAFNIADLVPTMMEAGATFIREKSNDANPFFAYFPLTAPHEPVVPPGFLVGSSGVTGPRAAYGDFIATVDWAVGRVLEALEDPNNDNDTSDSVLDETVIMFAADNGAETNVSFATSPGYIDGQLMRGRKQTIYEGGHRVPFLAQWSGHIPAGSVSSQVVELNDFMATAAQIVDYDLPQNGAEDSYDMTPVLFGQVTEPLRDYSVQHSVKGAFTIRHVDETGNEWKLIFTPNDGGLGGTAGLYPLNNITDFSQLQMYNLKNDPGEAANLLAGGGTPEMRTRALEMQSVLRTYITTGRSAPLPGDYNGDNFVNGLDYNVWRAKFGTTDRAADGNADGKVDAADYVVWRNGISAQGTGTASVTHIKSASAVPEPAAWVTLMLGWAAIEAHRAHRRRHPHY